MVTAPAPGRSGEPRCGQPQPLSPTRAGYPQIYPQLGVPAGKPAVASSTTGGKPSGKAGGQACGRLGTTCDGGRLWTTAPVIPSLTHSSSTPGFRRSPAATWVFPNIHNTDDDDESLSNKRKNQSSSAPPQPVDNDRTATPQATTRGSSRSRHPDPRQGHEPSPGPVRCWGVATSARSTKPHRWSCGSHRSTSRRGPAAADVHPACLLEEEPP